MEADRLIYEHAAGILADGRCQMARIKKDLGLDEASCSAALEALVSAGLIKAVGAKLERSDLLQLSDALSPASIALLIALRAAGQGKKPTTVARELPFFAGDEAAFDR